MKIKYKLVEEERVEDAPFVGALISSIDCHFNCKNCFNQPLKNIQTKEIEAMSLIHKIKENKFNKGIILAGLEWTLQLSDLVDLLFCAKTNGLKTMLYTGHSFVDIKLIIENYGQYIDYVKCGKYEENQVTVNHIEYGVSLSSSNQHIYKKGVDY